MPKQTRKYTTAVGMAIFLGIDKIETQETLYRLLNEAGYYWDSGTQKWQKLSEDADAPTDLIRVRIWAEASRVIGAAYQMRIAMEEQGYTFLDQSEPYPCRPPRQLESRIYLLFK